MVSRHEGVLGRVFGGLGGIGYLSVYTGWLASERLPSLSQNRDIRVDVRLTTYVCIAIGPMSRRAVQWQTRASTDRRHRLQAHTYAWLDAEPKL